MTLQLIVAFVCLVAGLFQLLATMPHIGERAILRAARRITGVAMLSGALYIVYRLHEFGHADPMSCWILGLAGLGQLLFSMNTFIGPERTEELMRTARKAVHEISHA